MIQERTDSKGKKRYRARIQRNGKKLNGPWRTERGRADRDGTAKNDLAKLEMGGDGPRQTQTVSEYIDFHLAGLELRVNDGSYQRSSYDTADGRLQAFRGEFGDTLLDAIDPTAAEEFARKHRGDTAMIVTMLNRAVDRRVIDFNPFAGLTTKGAGRKNKIPFAVEEVEEHAAIARRLDPEYGRQLAGLITFAAYSGMRPSEIYALEWDDIDFDAMRIHVLRQAYKRAVKLPKGEKTRDARLLPQARDALLALPRTDALVFTSKQGKRLSASGMTGYYKTVAQNVGPRLDKRGAAAQITFYEYRHFNAHHLYVTCDFPARVVGAHLGHSNGRKVEELYGHGDHGALEQMDRYFDGATVAPLRAVK